MAVPGKEPVQIRFMREKLGRESFSGRRWICRLTLKYKMILVTPEYLNIGMIVSRRILLPEIIFLVPEVKMTSTVLHAEQTHT